MVDTSQDPKPGSAATSRPRFSQGPLLAGGSISSRAGATDSRAAARSPEPYSGSAPYWTGSGGSAVGGYAPSESDDVPLTASDSRDYTMGSSPPRSSSEMSGSTGSGILSGMAGVGGSAVQGHNRQDSQPLPRISEDGSKYSSEYFSSDYTYGTYPGPRRGNSSGVLWQQNRDSQRSAGWL